jgi:dCTP diphosphatase
MKNLVDMIIKFTDERDWKKFHSPKNLAISISLEASELLEIFQWMNQDDSYNLSREELNKVKDEIGDIFIYMLNIANKLNLDIIQCAYDKIEKNREKYPTHLSKGSSKKYNEL